MGDGSVILLVGKHVGHSVAGIRYARYAGELAVPVILAAIRRGINVIEANSLKRYTEFDRVVAPDLRHVVQDLVNILRFPADT